MSRSAIPQDALLPTLRIRAPLRCEGPGALDSAEEVESGARLAVRWLPSDTNASAAVSAMNQLPHHPALPRVRHMGEWGTHLWAALDFPEGELLTQLLGTPMSEAQVVAWGTQLAQALAEVHAQGLLHGEWSGDSILLLTDGRALLWDMPLVVANRLTCRRGEQRQMTLLPKTAAFLSPEKASSGITTEASDVYALGATLAYASGALMPEGPTLSVVHAVAEGRFRPAVPEFLSEPFQELLHRMLDATSALRPSAREASRSLTQLLTTSNAQGPAFFQPLSTAFVSASPQGASLSFPEEETKTFESHFTSDLAPFSGKPFVAPSASQAFIDEVPSVIVSNDLETLPQNDASESFSGKHLPRRRHLPGWLTTGLAGVFLILFGMGIVFALNTDPASPTPPRRNPTPQPSTAVTAEPVTVTEDMPAAVQKLPTPPKKAKPAPVRPQRSKASSKKADSQKASPPATEDLKRPQF